MKININGFRSERSMLDDTARAAAEVNGNGDCSRKSTVDTIQALGLGVPLGTKIIFGENKNNGFVIQGDDSNF